MWACSSFAASAPKAINGVLDLRGWDGSGTVNLDGEWKLYWNTGQPCIPGPATDCGINLIPAQTTTVPGSWTKNRLPLELPLVPPLEAARNRLPLELPQTGRATYHLSILVKPSRALYAIKVYEFPQSYRLYIGDQLLKENGRYNPDPSKAGRSLVRPVVAFSNRQGVIDLWIEAVSFNEKDPGPRRSLVFGLESEVRKVQDRQLMLDMLMVGVLMIMGLYHLGLYLQRQHDKGSLLFGTMCLTLLGRLMVTEEHYLHKYIPNFPARLEHSLDEFSFFVLVPLMAWIFGYFFAKDFYKPVRTLITAVFLVFSVVYLLAPSELLFTAYLAFTLLVGVYLGYVLFLGVKNRRSGSRVFLLGFLLFVATGIWDMLSYSNIIRSVYISPLGFIGFIFAQAYVLSMRFNQALYVSEQLTVNLEGVVAERTQALEESNRQLAELNITDALTGIHNRRYFDQELSSEWSRAMRTQRPIALCILDIDYFKLYNDHYGHQGGDKTLQAVAAAIAHTVGRAGDIAARYGGEEFVVLLPESSEQDALALAQRICHNIDQQAIEHQKSPFGRVSVSVGVYGCVPTHQHGSDILVSCADQALYFAKQQGRNRAVVFEAPI